jgi:hypothetical protein
MISPKVMIELHQAKLVPTQFTVTKPGEHAWSSAEQRRFWEAIHRFPQGPWTAIAAYVGSKSTRQAMTHAQKLRQKLSRWKRRVRNGTESGDSSGASSPRSEEMNDDDEDDESDEFAIKSEDMTTMQHDVPVKSVFDVAPISPDDVSYDNDEYLDDLLSDIEPVLENVVNFASSPRSECQANVVHYGPFASASSAAMYPADSKQSLTTIANVASPYYASYAPPTSDSSSWHALERQQPHAATHEYVAAPVEFRL